MRADQYTSLQELNEKLMDVFLAEADPDLWPGKGLQLGEMDQQTRGDRYWSKKNAVATSALVMRVSSLTQKIEMANGGGASGTEGAGADELHEAEDDLDKQVARAEKDAKRLLDQVQKSARHV